MATTTQVLGKVGLVDKGVYDVNAEYSRLDFVTDENNISTYISLANNNQGHSLEDPEYWRYLAKGKANTPAEVLDLLLKADGPNSGLDADKLDGTELEEIVNPEEVTSASPFDFFLGAKEITQEDGTKKWVFQKMSPQNMATVAAGLMPGHRVISSPTTSEVAVAICRIAHQDIYRACSLFFRLSGYNGGAIGIINIQFSAGKVSFSKYTLGPVTYTSFYYKKIGDYYYIYVSGTNASAYSHSYWDIWSSEKEFDLNIDNGSVHVSSLGGTSF